MTAKIHLSHFGNSLALPIPDYIISFFNLKADNSMICSIENGKMIIEPINRRVAKYTLDELLAGELEPSEEIFWGQPVRRRSLVRYLPERGHFIRLNFDPQAGHEQMGTRPALIVSHIKEN